MSDKPPPANPWDTLAKFGAIVDAHLAPKVAKAWTFVPREVPPEDRLPKYRPIAERLATEDQASLAAKQAAWALDYDTLERWGREPSLSEQIERQRVKAGLGPGNDPAAWTRQYLAEFPRPEDPGPAIELLRREILAGRLSLSMVTSALVDADREARRRPRDVRDLP